MIHEKTKVIMSNFRWWLRSDNELRLKFSPGGRYEQAPEELTKMLV